jgi:ATP-binding cassette, subfamily A (ABC1), member 3
MDVLAKPHYVHKSIVEKFLFQVRLLIWKRLCELTKQKIEIVKLTMIPLLIMFLLMLVYAVSNEFAAGGIEPYFVPVAFWILTQKTVVNITFEKNNKLQEALRMMGLLDIAYWMSYFIVDGIFIGFFVSFLCTLCSLDNLFNSGNFGAILGMFFSYTLSGTSFAFFLCSFFDSAQTAGQATILALIGLYVVYLAADIATADHGTQAFMCLFPPMALQIAAGSFLKSYKGISLPTICGIMFADIFLYAVLAWYFSQVWPTSIGVAKPWHFLFHRHYWESIFFANKKGGAINFDASSIETPLSGDLEAGSPELQNIPIEKVNEGLLGKPTVQIRRLRKLFGSQLAVNNITLNMYENQIFALLGHNGAGKTTTINMLTGLIRPDVNHDGGAAIYGHSIDGEMDDIRMSMGVCPQHDVLFDNLTVREHILLASQLKGFSYAQANEEAVRLTNLFHLDKRLDHTGSELSGGQKRKLSVSLAICGGSKFIVLDEPTAGMDPLARRELWDLLATLRQGRTMLLTTHYMDEADVLGDRVAIMSLGALQCVGTSQFLKVTFGAGYKLIFDKTKAFTESSLPKLSAFVQQNVPGSRYESVEGDENLVHYVLPFTSVKHFGAFFDSLETSGQLQSLDVQSFGVTITSLEDVFLKVGEDHSVTPKDQSAELGIGSDRTYTPYFTAQLFGIIYRKLNYAIHDYVTFALVGVPICCSAVVAGLYAEQTISGLNLVNDLIASGIYIAGYLGAAGLIAEFIVRERTNKLRNVLTVMGCDFKGRLHA